MPQDWYGIPGPLGSGKPADLRRSSARPAGGPPLMAVQPVRVRRGSSEQAITDEAVQVSDVGRNPLGHGSLRACRRVRPLPLPGGRRVRGFGGRRIAPVGSDEFSVPGSAGRRGRCCPYSLRALGPVLLLSSYTPRGGLYRFPRPGV